MKAHGQHGAPADASEPGSVGGRRPTLEADYWRLIKGDGGDVEVEYANDLSVTDDGVGSGFPLCPVRGGALQRVGEIDEAGLEISYWSGTPP